MNPPPKHLLRIPVPIRHEEVVPEARGERAGEPVEQTRCEGVVERGRGARRAPAVELFGEPEDCC